MHIDLVARNPLNRRGPVSGQFKDISAFVGPNSLTLLR
jgi:hypothetical protein